MKKKETHSFTRRHQIFYKKKRKTDIKKEKEGRGKEEKTEQIGLDWIQNKTKKTFKFSKAAQFSLQC